MWCLHVCLLGLSPTVRLCVSCGLQARLNESQSKNKLYFGNLPRSYTQKQLEDELKKVCKGALRVAQALVWPFANCASWVQRA